MKRKTIQFFVILQFITLFTSCDHSGNLFLTNGYEYNVMVRSFYDHNATIIERFNEFYPGSSFAAAARHVEYSNVISIQVETMNGTVLASYTPDYLTILRKAYLKRKNQMEFWIFTEKGLFLETDEISKRYKFDKEKILAYYRSDEALKDLQEMLKTE
jgi:hypothetical protein